ncbi:hypothetical protein HZ326_12584 [Fusarium oxysporum f. sp. albedinis]|nr:hypothetical protein HZ326_12584 [Fusarium oxysporum f. sp. albedinis]
MTRPDARQHPSNTPKWLELKAGAERLLSNNQRWSTLVRFLVRSVLPKYVYVEIISLFCCCRVENVD